MWLIVAKFSTIELQYIFNCLNFVVPTPHHLLDNLSKTQGRCGHKQANCMVEKIATCKLQFKSTM